MEHRLIYRNLADYDNVRYNSRTAQANATAQDAARIQTSLDQFNKAQRTATDPAQKAGLSSQAKQIGSYMPENLSGAQKQLAAAKTVYGAAAEGDQSSYQNGQTYNVGSGEIQRSAAQRLIDSGMNPDQVYNQMEKSQGQASQTMTNTGLGAQYDQRGNVIAGSGRLPAGQTTMDPKLSKADQIEAQLRGQGIADPITIANAKAAALTEETAQMQKDQASKEISDKNAVATATSNAAAGAAASESTGNTATPPATPPATPQDAGLSAAIAGLPPEYAFLGPVLQAQQAEFAKAQADQQALYNKTTGTTDAAYDAIDKRIDGVESSYKAGTEAIQGLLSQVKEQQSKNIDEQEKAAKDRLAWSELQQSREIERNKVKAVDSKVASLALRGGFGSGAGLSEIEETTRSYENALDDLRSEYGVQRTELGAKFTALHNQVFTDYATNSINNIKDMLSAVERIGQQKNASTEARAKAENDALTTLITNQTNLRQQAAKELTNGVKEIGSIINTSRDDKRAQETLGYSRLKSAIDTYGTNVPQTLVDQISKQLPGVDVRSIIATPTAAALKKAGGGGSGGGSLLGFSISERTATGQALSLDNFLADREAAWHRTEAGPVSPQQRKEWTKEYNAKLANEAVLSPIGIMKDFQIKLAQAGNFSSVAQQETTQQNVEQAIKSGDYQFARDIVDGIGAKPPEKTIAQVTSLQRLQGDLEQMSMLVDRIESKVGPLPTQGAMWAWMSDNIESDPDYVRLKQLRDSNLAPYARGVSGDKGATTEPDVQRVMSSIINENTSAEAMKAALEQSKRQVNSSVTLYLKGMRDGGYRVNKLQESYEASQGATPTTTLSPEQQNWLYSQ